MKRIGLVILALGVVGLLATLGMDTTLSTSIGRLNNIGLMNQKQNYLLVAIAMAIVGAILFAISSIGNKLDTSKDALSNRSSSNSQRSCPYCAERIQRQAILCRYCGKDIEPPEPNAPNDTGLGKNHHIVPLLVKSSGTLKLPKRSTIVIAASVLAVVAVLMLFWPSEQMEQSNYIQLENMVVNLADEGGEKVAQIGITVELLEPHYARYITMHLPTIRSGIMLLVSAKKSSDLLDAAGKTKLQQEIKVGIESMTGHLIVERILFSSFIVQ